MRDGSYVQLCKWQLAMKSPCRAVCLCLCAWAQGAGLHTHAVRCMQAWWVGCQGTPAPGAPSQPLISMLQHSSRRAAANAQLGFMVRVGGLRKYRKVGPLAPVTIALLSSFPQCSIAPAKRSICCVREIHLLSAGSNARLVQLIVPDLNHDRCWIKYDCKPA